VERSEVGGGGWFDSPLAENAAHLKFHSSIALTELDALDGIDPIRICIGYELEDRHIE